jgi:hypothetical protein
MARLAHYEPVVETTQELEEPARYAAVKIERRRQLHEERAALATQAIRFKQKPFQQDPGTPELVIVRNRAWNFDGESKILRRAGRPPGVRGRGVRAMKRRVDLGAAENATEALQVRPVTRTPMRGGPRNRPASCAGKDAAGHVRVRAGVGAPGGVQSFRTPLSCALIHLPDSWPSFREGGPA